MPASPSARSTSPTTPGGAVGLGILVTIFAGAGSGSHGAQLLATRASASLTGATIFLALAVIVTLTSHPRKARSLPARVELEPRLGATESLAYPGAEALSETRAAA